ncbi:uracil-DNA glycosylase [Halococcus saccharolyticus]|uniref:Uracil-DNA glycosylase n=1 Tax=Halococcus saccharolyticus DSM 5350 TaxID=1227455 RepID=M0MHG3_9EURY|nr:uracil-DNA glycosylase [Halococcus saccharolyticus]EMA43865.1 uracil-DNA glycosylase [Halococcus saccharolyticus DSM 5350]
MSEFPNPESRNALVADCRRCPALVESRACISWGNGALDADLVVVGEAPGAGTPEADRWQGGNWTGMAYTTRHSGRKIRELFADLGYDSDECYFTNGVKCFPEGEDGSNREPTAEERANCRPYLEREIEDVEPRAVVATGKHATESLLATEDRDLDGFIDAVLEPVSLASLDTTLVRILHPSYQEVWVSRLDYTRESYLDAIGETLAEID